MTLEHIITYALLGGILPALLWLLFWLREDSSRPEPRGVISRTFVIGMLAVFVALPLQEAAVRIAPGMTLATFFLWAIVEEGVKFFAAYISALRLKVHDEPIDAVIYMITAALGFVALENALFIFNPLIENDILGSIMTGNLRFIGASLLHTVSSATIGVALALSYYRNIHARRIWGSTAFVIAVCFHTIFNIFIMRQENLVTLFTFGTVWIGIIVLLLFFERIKSTPPPRKSERDSI